MLVWEEDVKPAKVIPASPAQSNASATRVAIPSPVLATVSSTTAREASPTPTAAITPPIARRVNAAA